MFSHQTSESSNLASVLVVDDSRAILGMVITILQDQGFECATAADGFEALEVLQTKTVDLVLTDLWMDGLDGYGLIQKIKENSDFSHLPVLVMTTDTTSESRERLMQAGALHILSKPFNSQQLISVVRRAVDVRWLPERFPSESSRTSA